jgi:hypothetical protein
MNFKNLHESSLYELLDNISDVMYNLHFKTTPHYIKEDIKQFMMMKCLNTLKIEAYDPQYCIRNYFMSCCRNAGSVYIYHSNKLSVCYDISDSQVPELTTNDDEMLLIYSEQIYNVCKTFAPVYGDITPMIIDILNFYGVDVTINHKYDYDGPVNTNVKVPPMNTLQRILGLCIWSIVREGI